MAAVDYRGRPVDRPRYVESLEQHLMQALPHPSVLPVPQPPRDAGHARAAQLLGTKRHAIPVTNTNTIALNAARSGTLGRPVAAASTSGRRGSTASQTSSRTSKTFAIGHPKTSRYVDAQVFVGQTPDSRSETDSKSPWSPRAREPGPFAR